MMNNVKQNETQQRFWLLRFFMAPGVTQSLGPILIALLLAGWFSERQLLADDDARTSPQQLTPPNVVLVMADDQGWGDMGYTGHPVVATPHFDSAASAGLRFDRFYAAAPVCSPTRASVMIGRHPNRSGVFKWGYPLRTQEVTIAEQMQRAGYATGHFGKWHLGSVRPTSPVHPGKHGFDFWLSAPNFYDNDPILSRMGQAVKLQGESSLLAAQEAIQWIGKQVSNGHPFFAVVWFGSPHNPHRASKTYRTLYEGHEHGDFLGEITAMDEAFGNLRTALRSFGVRDNTLLWYCSDNGALRGKGRTGGFRGRKGSVYEGGLLVPSIIEWPNQIDQPRSTMIRCTTSDIFPTLCELTDVPLPDRPMDGVSLVPMLQGQMTDRDRPLGFWDYSTHGISVPARKLMKQLFDAQANGKTVSPYPGSDEVPAAPDVPYPTDSFPGHAAWIDGDWKLHRKEVKSDDNSTATKVTYELYFLARDPHETTDRITEQAARAKRMQEDLETWLTSVAHSLNGRDYYAPSDQPN